MATDSFKFWDSYYSALKLLGDNERRGRFVMALCAYVFDGIKPELDDDMLAFGFELVATQAMESMEISRAAQEAGSRGGRPRKDTSKRGAKSTPKSTPKRVAKRGAERGAESEKKREEEKRTESSSLTRNPTVAPGGVLAPPPAPDDAPPPLP